MEGLDFVDYEEIRKFLFLLRPLALTLLVSAAVLALANRVLLSKNQRRESDTIVGRQLVMLGLTIVTLVAIILTLPLSPHKQGQLMQLLGLVLSGAIALSSTNLLGNIMSGLMLRAVQSFRLNDFIEVGEEFGRVSERGLFHVEIQTPLREFTTIPNSVIVSSPVRVIPTSRQRDDRDTQVVVNTTVSLGYDVPRPEVEQHLLAAAERAGLVEPYVRVLSLGDFSVTYQIAGMLVDVDKLLRTRSRINVAVLDSLHEAGIEIVSPFFMNERGIAPERTFIPRRTTGVDRTAAPAQDAAPAAVFDKASSAALRERFEELRRRLEEDVKNLRLRVDGGETAPEGDDPLETQLARAENHLERVEMALAAQDPDDAD